MASSLPRKIYGALSYEAIVAWEGTVADGNSISYNLDNNSQYIIDNNLVASANIKSLADVYLGGVLITDYLGSPYGQNPLPYAGNKASYEIIEIRHTYLFTTRD